MARYITKQNKALLAELVRTDFKLRYQGSVLGYAWSLLRPLLLFVVLYIVFAKFLKFGGSIPHYPIYLLLGVVVWNFFNEMTVQGTTSIVGRGDLIRKISIPRWMIVVSTSLSALINFALNLVVVAVFMVFSGVGALDTLPFVVPIIFEVYVFALGLSFLLAALFVKFRDIGYIWEVILSAGFYATPILYPLSRITNVTFQKILMMNPMAQATQDFRFSAVTHQTVTTYQLFHDGYDIYIPFVIVLIFIVLGTVIFKKQSKYFAENI